MEYISLSLRNACLIFSSTENVTLAHIFRHASVSSTYPCPSVGWLVTPSEVHCINLVENLNKDFTNAGRGGGNQYEKVFHNIRKMKKR